MKLNEAFRSLPPSFHHPMKQEVHGEVVSYLVNLMQMKCCRELLSANENAINYFQIIV